MLYAAISNRNTTPLAFLLLLPPLGNRHGPCRVETMPVQPRPRKLVRVSLVTICDRQFGDASQLQQRMLIRLGPPHSRQDSSDFPTEDQSIEKSGSFLSTSARIRGSAEQDLARRRQI
jgi:hypothetical protein